MLYNLRVMGKLLAWFGIIVASWVLVWLIAKFLFWAWHVAQTGLVVGVIAIGAWLIWNYLAGRKSSEEV